MCRLRPPHRPTCHRRWPLRRRPLASPARQWQQLLHGERYSHSYSDSLPDFVKLAEAYGALGLRAETPDELDAKIIEMIDSPRPVLFDCRVENAENCFPMIPSGKAHNEMILGEDAGELGAVIDEAGRKLV